MATIRSHDLWDDVHFVDCTDFICIPYKTMSIPSNSRTWLRNSCLDKYLEDIQVDTVPNPGSIGISSESRFNYFHILCIDEIK